MAGEVSTALEHFQAAAAAATSAGVTADSIVLTSNRLARLQVTVLSLFPPHYPGLLTLSLSRSSPHLSSTLTPPNSPSLPVSPSHPCPIPFPFSHSCPPSLPVSLSHTPLILSVSLHPSLCVSLSPSPLILHVPSLFPSLYLSVSLYIFLFPPFTPSLPHSLPSRLSSPSLSVPLSRLTSLPLHVSPSVCTCRCWCYRNFYGRLSQKHT